MDFSSFSTEDLEALQKADYSSVSTEGLQRYHSMLSGQSEDQRFNEAFPAKHRSFMDHVKSGLSLIPGSAEALADVVSQGVSMPAGGVAGAVTGLVTQDPNAAQAVNEGVQNAMRITPQTDTGKALSDTVGAGFNLAREHLINSGVGAATAQALPFVGNNLVSSPQDAQVANEMGTDVAMMTGIGHVPSIIRGGREVIRTRNESSKTASEITQTTLDQIAQERKGTVVPPVAQEKIYDPEKAFPPIPQVETGIPEGAPIPRIENAPLPEIDTGLNTPDTIPILPGEAGSRLSLGDHPDTPLPVIPDIPKPSLLDELGMQDLTPVNVAKALESGGRDLRSGYMNTRESALPLNQEPNSNFKGFDTQADHIPGSKIESPLSLEDPQIASGASGKFRFGGTTDSVKDMFNGGMKAIKDSGMGKYISEQSGVHVLDLRGVMGAIARGDIDSHPFLRSLAPLADHILKNMGDSTAVLAPMKDNTGKRITHSGKQVPTETFLAGNGEYANATYQGSTNGFMFGTRGLNPATVMHEIFHQGTVNFMNAFPDHPLVKSLVDLYHGLYVRAEAQGKLKNGTTGMWYGLTNAKEFVSEGLANEKFREWVSSQHVKDIPLSQSTLTNLKLGVTDAWRAFTNFVLGMHSDKVTPDLNNAFQRLLHLTDSIAREHIKDKAKVDNEIPFVMGERAQEVASALGPPQKQLTLGEKQISFHNEEMSKTFADTSEATDKARMFRATPTAEERVKGPLQSEMNSFIDPDKPIEQAKAEILAEGEKQGPRFPNLQSGAINAAWKYKSALIETVGRYMQNAQKRFQNDERQFIRPLEVEMNTVINSGNAENVTRVLMTENREGVRFTPEDLQRAGLSKEAIEAHKKLRTEFDRQLDLLNHAREVIGKKAISGEEAYIASRWNGRFKMPVYLEGQGKTEAPKWYLADTTSAGVAKQLTHLKEQGIKVDETRSKLDPYRTNETPFVHDAYETMVNLMGKDDPMVTHLKDIMDKYVTGEVEAGQGGFKRHFEPKTGTRGFVGDRPGFDPKKDAQDFLQQQLNYIREANKWSHNTMAATKLKDLINDPEIVKNQPQNVNYSKTYLREKLGLSSANWTRQMETALANAFGKDFNSIRNMMGGLKGMFYHLNFGAGSLPFMLMQSLQTAFAIPYHIELGFKGNPVSVLAKSLTDGSAINASHLGMNHLPLSELGEVARKYIEANHISDNNIKADTRDITQNGALHQVERLSSISMTAPDQVFRTYTFMSFVHRLAEGGMKDHAEIMRQAEKYTNLTFGDMREGERPMIFSRMGLVGQSLNALQTFKAAYYNQLHGMGRMALGGKPAPLIAFLGVQFALGGALGMPLVDEADRLYKFTMDVVGKYLPVDTFKKMSEFGIRKWLLENHALLSKGPITQATTAITPAGVDIARSVGAPSVIPHLDPNSIFPWIGPEINEWSSIAKLAVDHSKEAFAEALFKNSPRSAQGPEEILMNAFKSQSPSGDLVKSQQGQAYRNPHDLTKFGTYRTPAEETTRMFGFTSVKESTKKELDFNNAVTNRLVKDKIDHTKDLLTKYIQRGDLENVRDTVKDMYLLGGTITGDELAHMVMQQELPRDVMEKLKLSSGKVSDIYQVLRTVKSLQNYKEQFGVTP